MFLFGKLKIMRCTYLINVFLGSDDSQRVRVFDGELKRGHGLGLVQGNADVTPSGIEIHFMDIFPFRISSSVFI